MFQIEFELADGTIIQTPYGFTTNGLEELVPSILKLKEEKKKYKFKDDNNEYYVNAEDIKSVKIVF